LRVVLLEVKQAACHRGLEKKNGYDSRAQARARGGRRARAHAGARARAGANRRSDAAHPTRSMRYTNTCWTGECHCIHRAISYEYRAYILLDCQQLNSTGLPVAQLAAYLTLRAQKSLHSAGLPAAQLYWISSSCTSKQGRMNRGKTGDGGGQCVPRRSKSFCWLGCIRFCSTVVSPFASDSFFSNRTFDWKLPARPAQRSADSATIIHESLKNNTPHR